MNPATVSLVTVCRNAQDLLPAAAASITSAMGAGDEWVVQDGASTDGSAEFLRDLADPRVRVESRPDSGIYDAMNRAVTRAGGDFILFLGCDDRLRIRVDEVRPLLIDPHTLYYGDVWRTTSQDRYAGAFDGARLARTNICHQSIFYPRAAFAGRAFDLRYTQQADWVFNMECFSDPRLRFLHLPLLVADFGQDGVSSTRMDEAFQRDYRRLLKKHFPFRQRWRPAWLSLLSDMFRALPGVPPPRQTQARP